MQYQKDNRTNIKTNQNPGGNSTFQLGWGDEPQQSQKTSVKVSNKQLNSQIQFGQEEPNPTAQGKNQARVNNIITQDYVEPPYHKPGKLSQNKQEEEVHQQVEQPIAGYQNRNQVRTNNIITQDYVEPPYHKPGKMQQNQPMDQEQQPVQNVETYQNRNKMRVNNIINDQSNEPAQQKSQNVPKHSNQSHFTLGDEGSKQQEPVVAHKKYLNKQQDYDIFGNIPKYQQQTQPQGQQPTQQTNVKVTQVPGGKSNIMLG